jgi:hypothetical protein
MACLRGTIVFLQLCCTFCVLAGLVSVGWGTVPESASNRDPYPQEKGPVEVYILAGQSNMQGHASLRNLEYLIYTDKTSAQYEHLKDRKGDWVERSDVWVWTNDGDRFGKLKPGFGSKPWKFGPELGFGWAVGSRLNKQVLLIKTCWGGRNVKCDFLSPGSPMPSIEQLEEELVQYQKRHPNATLKDIKARYGENYRQMIGQRRKRTRLSLLGQR